MTITPDMLHELMLKPWLLEGFGTRNNGYPHCLSVLRWAFKQLDTELPSDYIEILECFRRIEQEHIDFMDVVFMSNHRPFTDHAGVMIDKIKFVHCPLNGIISVSRITDVTWSGMIVGFARHKDRNKWNI